MYALGARYLENWTQRTVQVYVPSNHWMRFWSLRSYNTLEMMYWNHFVIISTIDLNNFVTLFFFYPSCTVTILFCPLKLNGIKKTPFWSVRPCIYDHSRSYALCMLYDRLTTNLRSDSKLYEHNIAYFDSKSRVEIVYMVDAVRARILCHSRKR